MSAVQTDFESYEPIEAAEQELRQDIRRQSNGDVVRFAAKGHQDAWGELVNRFAAMVQGVARRSGLGESDTQDVAQLTWLRLWQSLDKVRDPDHIAGWLATTARRESIRLAIGRSRQIPSAEPTLEYGSHRGPHPGADRGLLDRAYDAAIERALNKLPVQYRRLLLLLMSDAGLSYAEVAQALGVSVGSIGPMRSRSLQLLRRMPELASNRRCLTGPSTPAPAG